MKYDEIYTRQLTIADVAVSEGHGVVFLSLCSTGSAQWHFTDPESRVWNIGDRVLATIEGNTVTEIESGTP